MSMRVVCRCAVSPETTDVVPAGRHMDYGYEQHSSAGVVSYAHIKLTALCNGRSVEFNGSTSAFTT